MAKRIAKKEDFARVRAAIQREMQAGATFVEASVTAESDEPKAYRRILNSPDV